MNSENTRILSAVLGDMLKKASLPPGKQLTPEQVLEVMVISLVEQLGNLGKARVERLIEMSEHIERSGDDRLRTEYRSLLYEELDRLKTAAEYPKRLATYLLEATGLRATFEIPRTGRQARTRSEYSKLEKYLRETGIPKPE